LAIVTKGEYQDTPFTLTDHQYQNLLLDRSGNLRVISASTVLADATTVAGASSTLGKIGTVANAAELLIKFDASDGNYTRVLWTAACDQTHDIRWYRARTVVTGATITFADAKPIDDGDTFVLNGLTFTAETTEEDAVASERKYYAPDQATAAVNCAALLQHATYGVPGITASAAAVSATDVITIVQGTASVLQFAKGTSDADEIVFAATGKTSLIADDSINPPLSSVATTAAVGSLIYEQYIDGFPYAYMGVTNKSGSAAATMVITATPVV